MRLTHAIFDVRMGSGKVGQGGPSVTTLGRMWRLNLVVVAILVTLL